MTADVVGVVIAGIVALAFLALVGFLVWRVTPAARPTRILFAVAAVLASLPPVLRALLSAQA